MAFDPQHDTAPRRSGLAKLRGTPVLDRPESGLRDDLDEPTAAAPVAAPLREEPVAAPDPAVDLVKRPSGDAPERPNRERQLLQGAVALAVVAAVLLAGVLPASTPAPSRRWSARMALERRHFSVAWQARSLPIRDACCSPVTT
jgi:hypothetical protein